MMAIAALGAATPGIFTLEPMPLTPTIAKQYKVPIEHDPSNTLAPKANSVLLNVYKNAYRTQWMQLTIIILTMTNGNWLI